MMVKIHSSTFNLIQVLIRRAGRSVVKAGKALAMVALPTCEASIKIYIYINTLILMQKVGALKDEPSPASSSKLYVRYTPHGGIFFVMPQLFLWKNKRGHR